MPLGVEHTTGLPMVMIIRAKEHVIERIIATGVDPTQPPYETPPIRTVNSSLSKGLEKIINKCIELDPNKRYSNCLELIAALEKEQNSKANNSFFGSLFSK